MKTKKRTLFKVLAVFNAFFGIIILSYVLFPIISYEFNSAKFATTLSPVPDESNAAPAAQVGIDYTKASNWFAGGKDVEFTSSNISFYRVSIPTLSIEGATVAIGGEDLSESLIQYPGTALPGKRGNTTIFGHSILPQFYDPENYLAIFSKLPELERGDEIYIEYDGVSYKYEVEDMFEVSPTDIQILEQNNSDSFVSLVTCTPPGHPLRPKRLIVRARIVPLSRANTSNDNFRN